MPVEDRIVGIEQEYSVSPLGPITADELSLFVCQELAKTIHIPNVQFVDSLDVRATAYPNQFSPAGARIYEDAGVIETATPETTSGAMAALYQSSLAMLVARVTSATVDELRQRLSLNPQASTRVYSVHADPHGQTRGTHENYQIATRDAQLLPDLTRTFFLARGAVTDTGMPLPTEQSTSATPGAWILGRNGRAKWLGSFALWPLDVKRMNAEWSRLEWRRPTPYHGEASLAQAIDMTSLVLKVVEYTIERSPRLAERSFPVLRGTAFNAALEALHGTLNEETIRVELDRKTMDVSAVDLCDMWRYLVIEHGDGILTDVDQAVLRRWERDVEIARAGYNNPEHSELSALKRALEVATQRSIKRRGRPLTYAEAFSVYSQGCVEAEPGDPADARADALYSGFRSKNTLFTALMRELALDHPPADTFAAVRESILNTTRRGAHGGRLLTQAGWDFVQALDTVDMDPAGQVVVSDQRLRTSGLDLAQLRGSGLALDFLTPDRVIAPADVVQTEHPPPREVVDVSQQTRFDQPAQRVDLRVVDLQQYNREVALLQESLEKQRERFDMQRNTAIERLGERPSSAAPSRRSKAPLSILYAQYGRALAERSSERAAVIERTLRERRSTSSDLPQHLGEEVTEFQRVARAMGDAGHTWGLERLGRMRAAMVSHDRTAAAVSDVPRELSRSALVTGEVVDASGRSHSLEPSGATREWARFQRLQADLEKSRAMRQATAVPGTEAVDLQLAMATSLGSIGERRQAIRQRAIDRLTATLRDPTNHARVEETVRGIARSGPTWIDGPLRQAIDEVRADEGVRAASRQAPDSFLNRNELQLDEDRALVLRRSAPSEPVAEERDRPQRQAPPSVFPSEQRDDRLDPDLEKFADEVGTRAGSDGERRDERPLDPNARDRPGRGDDPDLGSRGR